MLWQKSPFGARCLAEAIPHRQCRLAQGPALSQWLSILQTCELNGKHLRAVRGRALDSRVIGMLQMPLKKVGWVVLRGTRAAACKLLGCWRQGIGDQRSLPHFCSQILPVLRLGREG